MNKPRLEKFRKILETCEQPSVCARLPFQPSVRESVCVWRPLCVWVRSRHVGRGLTHIVFHSHTTATHGNEEEEHEQEKSSVGTSRNLCM